MAQHRDSLADKSVLSPTSHPPAGTHHPAYWAILFRHRLVLSFLAMLGACAPYHPDQPFAHTAPNARSFWTAPTITASAPPQAIPTALDQQRLGLTDVLEVALSTNPVTRASWADARAAAAGYGSARAAYFPALSLDGVVGLKETHDSHAATDTHQQSHGPGLGLSWLLFDFGGRDAGREKALQSLMAANWSHNAALQGIILSVQKSYFQYMAAKAAVVACQADLKDNEQHLATAEALHQAGAATIADVLQMKTALSQTRLALQTAQGAIYTTRGALATAMGMPANLPFDIEDDPGRITPETISQQVDELIATALTQRPDLAAAHARYLASAAQAKKTRANGLPTLSLNGTAETTWFQVDTDAGNGPFDRREDLYTAGLTVRVPLFTGYANTHDTVKAEAEAEAQAERSNAMEQQVVLQVFQAYYALQTAIEKVQSVDDLLASAQQSETVAAARYKEGVGTILELVTAQTALTAARAQKIQAGWQWRTAMAQLAHDTGVLDLDGEPARQPRKTNPAR